MISRMHDVGGWLSRRAENLLVMMIGAMFAAFIIQIVFRYLFNLPIGWTHEISVLLWVWIVLFGAAFVVREAEEIRFDILYGNASGRVRRAMAIVTSLALVALFVVNLRGHFIDVKYAKGQTLGGLSWKKLRDKDRR